MRKKTDIHAVELVRRIRDQQADLLKGKSYEEIIEFFRKTGAASRRRLRKTSRTVVEKHVQTSM